MVHPRYLRVIWVLVGVATMVLAILLLAQTPPLARGTDAFATKGGRHTKVVCLDENTFKHEYKFRPHHCIFHERHSPDAEAFFVRTSHDRWKAWRSRHARGKGKHQPSMGGLTPARIKLFHPVTRCGHRVFSKARFHFPGLGTAGTLKLDTCASG